MQNCIEKFIGKFWSGFSLLAIFKLDIAILLQFNQ